jgi:hypothetical protein
MSTDREANSAWSARAGAAVLAAAAVCATACGGRTVGGSEIPVPNTEGTDAPPAGVDQISPGPGGGSQGIDAASDALFAPPESGARSWKTRGQTFCGRTFSSGTVGIWSDHRGVHVLESPWTATWRVYSKVDADWSQPYEPGELLTGAALTGFVDGPLVLYGFDSNCIYSINNGIKACSGAASATHVFTVNGRLAHAVSGDRLFSYDGSYWKQRGAPLSEMASAVWATSETTFVLAGSTRIFVYSAGAANPDREIAVPDIGAVTVWGNAPSELWIGGDGGQLAHYDGATWSVSKVARVDCGAIKGLWGSGDSIFFYTDAEVGVSTGRTVRSITSFECGGTQKVMGLWGNSAAEVVILTQDSRLAQTPCGDLMVGWFDGTYLYPL